MLVRSDEVLGKRLPASKEALQAQIGSADQINPFSKLRTENYGQVA